MTEDLRLSVSKTKTFLDCKAKYKFCYIEKLPRKEWDFHIFGKFCHSVLEFFHKKYIEGSSESYSTVMNEAFKNALQEYKGKMDDTMKKDCWNIINQYLQIISKNKKDNKLPNNVIHVEKRFEFLIHENLVLNGAIDRIQLDDDNVIHVADYKTTKNKKYLKDDFFQLLTYAYVIMQEDPNIEKVRASYILLRHNFEYITQEFSKQQILSIKDKYVEYANQIIAEKVFEPNPTALCNYCDYLDQCPSGKSKAYKQNIYGEVAW